MAHKKPFERMNHLNLTGRLMLPILLGSVAMAITTIAEQTNLLALNATIESARVGGSETS